MQVLFAQIYNQVTTATEKIRREIEQMANETTAPICGLMAPLGIEEYTHSLTSWTKRTVGRVIHEGFSDFERIRAALQDKRDVLLLFGSGKNVFGSFHERTGNVGEWVFDLNHFVFSIRNPFGYAPTQFKRQSKDRVLMLTSTGLMRVNGWAEIGTESFIDFMFPTHYVDTIGRGGDVFVGNVFLQTFHIDYFLALEMRIG